jgi:hypothetical protein
MMDYEDTSENTSEKTYIKPLEQPAQPVEKTPQNPLTGKLNTPIEDIPINPPSTIPQHPIKRKEPGRIPKHLKVKNIVNNGKHLPTLTQLTIKNLRKNGDHLTYIRPQDLQLIYRLNKKGKKINLTQRTKRRLVDGLGLVEEGDGGLYLTERGRKVKEAVVEAALELREKILRRRIHLDIIQ